MGFRWKRTEDKNRILIEKSNIRLKRIEYLFQLQQYCEQGRNIVYSDELYLERAVEQKAASKSQRVVAIHAGSEAGFIPNALLVAESHDDYSNISDDVYFDWLQNKLIPNLPPRSVVVVDTASPHDKEYDPAPSSNAKRSDMTAWLDQKGIHYTPDMYKPQLYQLINENKDRFKILALDKMLTDSGHDVLRIPAHHPDLNPIEMAWAAIKTYVTSKTKEFNVSKVNDFVKEKIDAIGPEEWKKMCQEVREIEDSYRNNELIIDTLSETIVAGDMDSSSESEDSDTSLSSDEDK
ncbi:uncharacterized protein LOC123864478 isoform X2 [Maniola jurtina]|nr:uncharacterized protein LOC123864478 isoform X2 [Maniola jurtina]XP_045760912.1 uncharacterized protein LOC123864478 isoform X2 [Maniola jurtina]